MELLILGAGGHGRVVAEVALAAGYDAVAFADDHSADAVGTMAQLSELRCRFSHAFVGIGNNRLRGELIEKLRALGYHVPVLVHPTAYVSPTAHLGAGTVVEPKALVNTQAEVAEGCIISVGAIIDHNAVLEPCVHANAGCIVKAGGRVEACRKLEAGELVLGYESAIVKK